MSTCILCGYSITEQDMEDGDYCDTELGEVHSGCLVEWRDDADERRRDKEYDWSIGT